MAALYKEQLGAVIKRRRKELGLTQKDLADRAHVEEGQTVSRWERGINSPTDLEAVAVGLETTAAELLSELDAISQTQRKRMEPHGLSQLDRIEHKVDELIGLFKQSMLAAGAPGIGGELGRRLQDAEPTRTSRQPPKTRKAPGAQRGSGAA